MRTWLSCLVVFAALCGPANAHAQFLGNGPRDGFRDTSILRPPQGAKVALIVFEDLGCPACAHAHPYEIEAIKQTHVAFERHDFPIPAHIWTFEGAVVARYIEDKISPELAAQFRTDVFASQRLIESKDDLHQFAAKWLEKHGQKMPSVLDPDGKLNKEVQADFDLGMRLKVGFTPTVVVVTRNAYQVVCGTQEGSNDPAQILPVLKAAIAATQ